MKRTIQFIAGVAFACLLTSAANASILYSFDWANGTGATANGSFEYISGDDFITDFKFSVDGYGAIDLPSVTLGADGLALDQQVGSIDGALVGTVTSTDGSTSVTFSDVFPETHFDVNNGSVSGSGTGTWIDLSGPVVPEPTTVISGALLLLPFGASTLRILRKQQSV